MMKESERSATVYTANWKETVELRRTVSDINRSKKTIEHSLYLDQKYIYKRFQTKLHQSQLFFSRLKGDREMERQLRAKSVQNCNTNCGHSEEEERKFQRLLRRPTTSRPGTMATPRTPVQATQQLFQNGVYRSKSVDALCQDQDTAGRVTFENGRHGSMTSLPGTPTSMHSIGQGQYLDTSKRAYEIRPHTIQGMPQQQSKIDTGLGERPGTVAALLEDEGERRRRVMTRINSHRVKSANFEQRVDKFCKSVNQMDTRTDNALDYYNVRLGELQKKNKTRQKIINIPKTPESEYWRHVGDYRKRPITFRGVKYDVIDDLTNQQVPMGIEAAQEQLEISDTDD